MIYAAVVDFLSDVIASMRTGRASSARVEWRAPWGQRFPAMDGAAGFQVILRGTCRLVPPQGDPITLGVGDVVFFPHGDSYGLADELSTPLAEPRCDPVENTELFVSDFIGTDGAATVTLCGGYQLDPTSKHPLLRDLPTVIHLPAELGKHPELRSAIELLGAEVGTPRLGADIIVRALLDMLLLYLLRAWFEDQPAGAEVTGWAAALADPAIAAALQAIHADPGRTWTVQTLADVAGQSRAAFARRFQTMTGRPPLTYLTWWRLATAGRLLRESDAPLNEIARQVGYTSEFAFATAFKREYGTAPGRYRHADRPVSEPGKAAAGRS
ncbi:AraC family transcriptional regulator [Nocardia sp. NPDC051030]|uniref:AraC family transcriptional regulator n=1 Tax=Nocardia sp. NPDC051030 TaxID=3155162 RepID=UPI003438F321